VHDEAERAFCRYLDALSRLDVGATQRAWWVNHPATCFCMRHRRSPIYGWPAVVEALGELPYLYDRLRFEPVALRAVELSEAIRLVAGTVDWESVERIAVGRSPALPVAGRARVTALFGDDGRALRLFHWVQSGAGALEVVLGYHRRLAGSDA
jgi:hypothetical protein